jgi:hypothetical protein
MFDSRKDLIAQRDEARADVLRLEAELETAQAKVDEAATLTQQVAELNEDLEACKLELKTETEAHEATKEAHATELTALNADLDAEKAKTTPDAINQLVTAQLATAGHPPIEEGSSTPGITTNTLSREAFNALSPREKTTFAKSGGKITD